MRTTEAILRGCVALALVASGCAEVVYEPVDTYDEVLATHPRTVRGNEIEARAWQSRTELRVQARWRCDRVQMQEVRRTTVEEPVGDVTGEAVLLGLSAVPLGFGVALLADSGNVYDNDRNAREYNPVGPGGAIAGGVVLLALGSVMAIVPAVELGRQSGSRETEEVVQEQGKTLSRAVSCDRPDPAAGAVVYGALRLGPDDMPAMIELGTTDETGRLTVDLAGAVPPAELARAPFAATLEIRVGDRAIGHADLSDVRLAQQQQIRQIDQQAWEAADADSCRRSPSEQSCEAVRAYLEHFPEGIHASQARDALGALAMARPIEIATDPTVEDEAARRAREQVQKVCATECSKACKGDADCVEMCQLEVCP